MNCPDAWNRIPIQKRMDMAFRVDLAVVNSFRDISRKVGGNPTEPDRVLSFFFHGLEEIERGWNSILRHHRLKTSLSGIFIHSTPKVIPIFDTPSSQSRADSRLSNPRTQSCELGDLLVIVTNEGNEPGTGAAILFQAKDGFPEHGDTMQRRLYEEADGFNYTSQSLFGKAHRNLPAKDSGALSYWDIESDQLHYWAHPYLYGTSVVDAADARLDNPRGLGRRAFGEVIGGLVFASAGEEFSPPVENDTGWNRIIRDLIEKTAAKALTNKMINTHGVGVDRGAESLIRAGLMDPSGPVVVRNSIAEAYHHLAPDDKGVASLGEKMEKEALTPGSPELEEYRKKYPENEGGFLPPLKPRKPLDDHDGDDDGSGGVNLVLIHCSRR